MSDEGLGRLVASLKGRRVRNESRNALPVTLAWQFMALYRQLGDSLSSDSYFLFCNISNMEVKDFMQDGLVSRLSDRRRRFSQFLLVLPFL